MVCPVRSGSTHLQLFSIHPSSTIILEKILRHREEMLREVMRTSSKALTSSPEDTGEGPPEVWVGSLRNPGETNEERAIPTSRAPREQVAPTLSSSWYFMILCTGLMRRSLSCRRCPSCCRSSWGQGQMGWFCSLESLLMLTILSPFPQGISATDLKIAVPKF